MCWCLDFPVDSAQSIHETELSTQQAQGSPQVPAQVLQGQLACATTPRNASTPVSPPALTEEPEESPQNFSRIQPLHHGAAFLDSSWVFRDRFSSGALLGPIDCNATGRSLKLRICLIAALNNSSRIWGSQALLTRGWERNGAPTSQQGDICPQPEIRPSQILLFILKVDPVS